MAGGGGGGWPQARQYAKGWTADPACLVCGEGPGTLWHRRYWCPQWHGARTQRVSRALRLAAERIGQARPMRKELFARGLLPDPRGILPRPKRADQLTVQWVNRPADGVLTGTLFLDGSGLHGRYPALRRAGWSIVQVDAESQLQAAVYGAVPWDDCPSQTARDGEDYAVAMLPLVAVMPFEAYIDCAGTISAIRSPHKSGNDTRSTRVNLWSRVWAAFEEIWACKTKAHASIADVHRGVTTFWERRGNDNADRLAKKGAHMHGLTDAAVAEYHGIRSLAYQAARWAAEQRVLQQMSTGSDAHILTTDRPRAAHLSHRPAKPGVCTQRLAEVLAEWGRNHEGTETPEPAIIDGHRIFFARLSCGGQIMICGRCGAYARAQARALRSACRGLARHRGAAAALKRLRHGYLPAGAGDSRIIGSLVGPNPDMAARLTQCLRARSAGPAPQGTSRDSLWDRLSGPRPPLQTRASLLNACGLTEEALRPLAAKWACRGARRLTEEDDTGGGSVGSELEGTASEDAQ